MLGCLTEFAKPYVEKLINGTAAEFSYICCFTCIAKDFEEEKARLEPIRTTIKQRIDVAVRNGEDVQAIAHSLKEEADKLIQEDTKTKQKCFFELCPHCLWRYKRGKVLAKENERIKKLIEDAKTLEIGIPALLPGVEMYSSQNFMHFKSREFKYKELLDALKDDNNYIIGLQGMGGTGKTTLIKEVGKKLQQSKHFTYSIDTTVSASPDIKKIQNDIAGSLGLKLDDCNEPDRRKKLWSRLTNGEKILLILDDVWDYIDFNDIGIPYRDDLKGCRIIVTTRNMWVCNKFGCNKTIQLDLLSEEDAWIMFKRHADLSETSNKNLLHKGRKIANECKRLPIAIAVIASSLKGEKRRDEWDVTLKSLQKHMSMPGVEEEVVKIYQCLKFSYDNLKNEKAKSIFLLCSVFREDEEILTEMLTRLAIGGGLFGEDYVSYEDARSQVGISKNKLLDSCLLLKASQWRVKMHDLVRDAAQWVANKEIQTVQVYDKNQKAILEREKNIKYVLCEGKPKDVFSCKLGGSKLEILIVIMNEEKDDRDKKIELPDSFFGNNIDLRVLYLSYSGFRVALSLPQSMQSLKNIRSLIIKSCDLGDISILGNLQSLETLDLVRCHINELPHEITKLEKFRLLRLEGCKIRRNNPFEVIEKCSSLEELYFTYSFNDFCQEINFPKLHRFYLDDGLSSVDDSFTKYMSLQVMDGIFLHETTLKYCMQEAEILRLKGIEGGWKNIIPDIIPLEHGMNDMVKLSLRCISQLQCLIDSMHTNSLESNVFYKLAVLTLSEMENLEELCNGPLSFDSLKSLEKLSIMDCKHLRNLFKCNLSLCNLKEVSLVGCPMLISIFELSTARSLVLLERLEIFDCAHLEYILTDERKWEGSRREIVEDDSRSCDPKFLKLKVLKIEKCPKFEIILPFVSAHDLPALESIEMKRCDKLKYIFGQDVELGSLKNIKLDDVPNLIDIFRECNPTMSLSIKRPSFISEYSSDPPTQSDPIKCNIFSWSGKLYGKKLRSTTSTEIPPVYENQPQNNSTESNSDCLNINIWKRAQCLSRQSMILCNVKEIKLTQLRKIKSVFILSIAPRMLLETLKIEDCDELKHVIIDTRDHDNSSGGNNLGNVFPKLKVLSIENCIQLEYIFGRYTYDNQNHIEVHLHLPALESLYLANLPSFVAICPKQYYTTFLPLKRLVLKNCLQVADMKPMGDFIPHHSVPKSIDGTITKELSGNIECLLALERLWLNKSKVESIFCINEINEEQINSVLQRIELKNLYVTSCLFVGPKNSLALQHLIRIKIARCEKLQVIFSHSILKCLPQLVDIILIECDELKHIIEDDLEDKKMSNSLSSRTCFPKLNVLVVEKCNKLKYVFPVSMCNELPKLKSLIIREAYELEVIFKSEGEEIQKVKIPNLKFVAIMNLPSLFQNQGIQFQHVEYLFVMDCQNHSLTSASIPDSIDKFFDEETLNSAIYFERHRDLWNLLEQLKQEFKKGHDTGIETSKDFVAGIEVEAASRHEMKSSQLEGSTSEKSTAVTMSTILETKNETPKQKGVEISIEQGTTGTTDSNVMPTTSTTHLELTSPSSDLLITSQASLEKPLEFMNEHSTSPLGATDATVKSSQENNKQPCLPFQKKKKIEPTVQLAASKQKLDIEISVDQGTTSSNVKTITSLTHLELENGDGQIALEDVVLGDSQETAQTNNQVSLSDDHAFMKKSSIIEEQFPKDNEIIVSKSKRSSFASQFPSTLSQGDSSQIVEDFGSSLLVPTELEQLVSEKHLHRENLSLLTDFLVKHPSLLLRDTSLSNRYKGCAYNILAELLKFLQTHSVLDVLGSSHSEFVELLQDARRFPFDKEWLDVVEKCVLFPGLQVSQAALQKLLDSKHILTEHVKDLKHQLASSEAVLESITQQEAHILETRAALSHPIGY